MQRTICNTAALALEASSVWLALPITTELYGSVSGSVLAAGLGITIYALWYTAFNSSIESYKRALLCLVSLGLLAVVSFTIFTGKKAPDIKAGQAEKQRLIDAAAIDRKEAMQRWEKQVSEINATYKTLIEQRGESLKRVNSELKATIKAKQPKIYASLVSNQMELLKVPVKPALPKKPVLAEIKQTGEDLQMDYLAMIQAGLYSLLVPILLLVGSLGKPFLDSFPVRQIRERMTVKKRIRNARNVCHVAKPENTIDSEPLNESDPFLLRKIPLSPGGFVTKAAISNYFIDSGLLESCGGRVQTRLRDQAVENGYLAKSGIGYVYCEPVKSVNVVSIRGNA